MHDEELELKDKVYKSSSSSNEVANLLTPIQLAQKFSIDMTEEEEDDGEINIQDILNQRNQYELEAAQGAIYVHSQIWWECDFHG